MHKIKSLQLFKIICWNSNKISYYVVNINFLLLGGVKIILTFFQSSDQLQVLRNHWRMSTKTPLYLKKVFSSNDWITQVLCLKNK